MTEDGLFVASKKHGERKTLNGKREEYAGGGGKCSKSAGPKKLSDPA